MPFNLSVSEDGTYVLVKVTGPINGELAMVYLKEGGAMGFQHGINCGIVDLTEAVNTETQLGIYSFVNNDIPVITHDNSVNSVLLVRADDHSFDFLETVAGFAGIKLAIRRSFSEAVAYISNDTAEEKS